MAEYEQGRQLLTTADEDFHKPETPPGLIRLDIACGQQKKEGFVGIDIDSPLADVKHDLDRFPWPFEDNSVYEAYCSHYIEHVTDMKRFMEEVHRVLMPLGLVHFIGPFWTSERAWQDYTHKRALTPRTMMYFDQEWLHAAKIDHYAVKADFKSINTLYIFDPEWEPRSEEAKLWALKHYVNVVMDIQYILKAIKPIRAFGPSTNGAPPDAK